MDTGSWQGTVHSIAKSRTRLRQLSPQSEASGIQKLKENLKKQTHTHTHTHTQIFPAKKPDALFGVGREGICNEKL